MSAADDDVAELEFSSESALLASLRALLSESALSVSRCITPRLVSAHASALSALLADTGAQQTEQFIELVVCACVAVAKCDTVTPALCAQLESYIAIVIKPPSAVQRVASHLQLIRLANAVFDIALRSSSSFVATSLVRSLHAVFSLQLVPLAERWLELLSSSHAASDDVVELCCRALRQLAPNAGSPELVARVLTALGGARAAGDSRLLRMYLLVVCDLFASPPTLDIAATDAWLDLFESLRADAEQSRAAFDALGELIDSIYAHFVRHLSPEMRAATLARLAATADDAFVAVARHALLCECVASPPPSALDSVDIAAAVLDGVAGAHAAAQRAAGERAILSAPWRRASFAVSVWLTTAALHSRGALSDEVETLLWRRVVATSRVVAVAAAGAWAFALRNGTPEYRRRQTDILLVLLERNSSSARIDDRLAQLLARALPFVDAADAVRLAQCIEQLPRLYDSPLRSTLSVCGASRLRALPTDLSPYREPLPRPVELVLLRCAFAPKTCARHADSLLRWCVMALAALNPAAPRNAALLLDAAAALASLPRTAPLAVPQHIDGAMRTLLALVERPPVERGAEVQLGVRRLLGASSAFVLPPALFDGTFAQLFRAVLAPMPTLAWPMRSATLAAFQQFAKYAADVGKCQSLLSAETTPLVLAFLNQQVREVAPTAVRREAERRAKQLMSAAAEAVVEADEFVAQLRELASLIESGVRGGNVDDGALRASVAAAVVSGRARGKR